MEFLVGKLKVGQPLSDDELKQIKLLTATKTAEIKPSDLGTLIICALRYCVGRRTYMPVMGIARVHWDFLNEKDKQVIAKDVKAAIERGSLGDDCDIAEWNRFNNWVRDKLGQPKHEIRE